MTSGSSTLDFCGGGAEGGSGNLPVGGRGKLSELSEGVCGRGLTMSWGCLTTLRRGLGGSRLVHF